MPAGGVELDFMGFAMRLPRRLPKSPAAQIRATSGSSVSSAGYLRIYAAEAGVAMIDTRRPDWTFMFGNATFCAASCRNIYDLLASGFWDIFEPTGQVTPRPPRSFDR